VPAVSDAVFREKANWAILTKQGFLKKVALEDVKLTVENYVKDRDWTAAQDGGCSSLRTHQFLTPQAVPAVPAVAFWIDLEGTMVWVISSNGAPNDDGSYTMGYNLHYIELNHKTERGMIRAEHGQELKSNCTPYGNLGGWEAVSVATAKAAGVIFVLAAKFQHKGSQRQGQSAKEMMMMQCQQLPHNIRAAFAV